MFKKMLCVAAMTVTMFTSVGTTVYAEEVPAQVQEMSPQDHVDIPADPINLSPEVSEYCRQAAEEFGFDRAVLEALVWKESTGNVGAKNGSHIGLTQINPGGFKATMQLLGVTDVTDPLQNVRVCAYSLATWNAKYGNIHIALDCWNRGENAAAASNRTEGTKYTNKIYNNALIHGLYL